MSINFFEFCHKAEQRNGVVTGGMCRTKSFFLIGEITAYLCA